MRRLLPLLLAALPLAAPATTTEEVLQGRFRPGWQMENGHYMAAVDMALTPGWKTYWRAPGEAGIPPEFDWSGSENLAAVAIHWPSPAVFHANGLQTVGYHDGLVLPLEIVPKDPARPVQLRLQIALGVCKDICMPAELRLSADLQGQGAPDPAIRKALAQAPETGREAGLQAIACDVAPITDGLRLTARIDMPPRSAEEVVIFEAGDPGIWVSESASQRQGGTLIASADLVPPSRGAFALDRSDLRVTILGSARAVEIIGCPAP